MPSGGVGRAAYRRCMLTAVAVSGYRSLRDVVVPLHGLDVVTGANGSGKSSLYRSLRLLAGCGRGEVIGTLAREGGLQSALWAGPATLGGARDRGHAVQGTRRKGPISLQLGFASDDFGYLVDLGLPQQASGSEAGARQPSCAIPRSSARSSGRVPSCGQAPCSSGAAGASSRPATPSPATTAGGPAGLRRRGGGVGVRPRPGAGGQHGLTRGPHPSARVDRADPVAAPVGEHAHRAADPERAPELLACGG